MSIDEKGRIAVPSVFRRLIPEALEPALHIVAFGKDRYPHLKVFTQASFEELKASIAAIPDATRRAQYRFVYVGGAVSVNPDAQGRIPVGQQRAAVGFDGARAFVVGQDTTFDIYDEATFNRRQTDALAMIADDDLVLSW